MQDYIGGDKFAGDKISGDKIIYNVVSAPARAPLLAPPAPPHGFVDRPAEFEQIVALLTSGAQAGRVAITAALRGAGGYGKTALAQKVCQDARVRAAFPDGLFWVTLGERPEDLRSLVVSLVWRLTGEPPNVATLAEATSALADALGQRKCLLVIDDAWSSADLYPFLQGGSNCTRLITTRDEGALPRNAAQVPIDKMQTDQALALLCNKLEQELETNPNQRPRLAQLAARLGGWPLLLKLVNGALVEELRDTTLRRAIMSILKQLDAKGLFAFDPTDAEQRRRAAAGAIEVSLERLGPKLRQRHAELAIFPEDSDIPLAAVAQLWSATDDYEMSDSEELCARLQRLSLLLRYDVETRTIRLHDVVRSYLTTKHDLSLPAWHRALLAAYRPPTTDWYSLPADASYVWDNLGYHLEGAELADELVATVCDLRYLVRKMALRNVTAAEADLNRALRLRPDDETLALLERRVRLYSHVLRRCANDSERAATLAVYLSGFPLLKTALDQLMPLLPRPFLTSLHPIDTHHPALLRTLDGHSEGVTSAAYSPDGTRIVSASDDGTLKQWDARSGNLLQTFDSHSSHINSIAYSPDGMRIVSASRGGMFKQWDARSGRLLQTFDAHSNLVWSVVYSLDGKQIVSTSHNNTLKFWDSESGALIRTDKRRTSDASMTAYSPNGKQIVSVISYHDDDVLEVRDADNGANHRTIDDRSDRITSVAYSADGLQIVSGFRNGIINIWDAERETLLQTLSGHTGPVRSVAYSRDSKYIVSASADCTLKIWDAESRPFPQLENHRQEISGISYSPNSMCIVSASNDGTLKLWDTESGTLLQTLHGSIWGIRSVAYSPDGMRIVSASSDYTLKLWDAHTGKLIQTLEGHRSPVTSATYSPNGMWIASASDDQTLKVWDANSGTLLRTLEGHTIFVLSVAYSSDSTRIVSADYNGTLKVWNPDSGALLHTIHGHGSSIWKVVYSPDNVYILSADNDGILKMWNADNGVLVQTLEGHSDGIKNAAYSPDGTHIVSASLDGTLKLWDARSGRCLTTFHAEGALYCCAFAPDGRTVAMGGEDRQVYILRIEGMKNEG